MGYVGAGGGAPTYHNRCVCGLTWTRLDRATEHELLCAIEMWEFMHQSWISKTREKDAPHIVACIQRFNDVGQWVASSILKASADVRLALLEFFIRLAHECYTLRNYCGTLQVLSGLQTMPVLRLKNIWNVRRPVAASHNLDAPRI